jgi:hypothetical protein
VSRQLLDHFSPFFQAGNKGSTASLLSILPSILPVAHIMPPKGSKRAKKTPASTPVASSPRRSPSPIEHTSEDDPVPEVSDVESDGSRASHASQGSQASHASQAGRASQQTKRKKYKERLILDPEDQDTVAGWFRQNEMFWNKYHEEYKNKALKLRMLEDLAATLNSKTCTADQLRTWLESMRTQFGKLCKAGPSGSGKPILTEREAWILRNFEVCRAHITRLPGRSGIKVGFFFGPYNNNNLTCIGIFWIILFYFVLRSQLFYVTDQAQR